MKVIVHNKTRLNTAHIRAIVAEVCRRELFEEEHLVVRVINRKRSSRWRDDWTTGFAYYKQNEMVLKVVDGVALDREEFAHVVAHELAHCQGVRHGGAMRTKYYGWAEGWREVVAWAKGMALDWNALPVKKVDSDNEKLEHCQRQVDAWTKKARLAKTKIAKWTKRVRYYEKKLLAPVELEQAALTAETIKEVNDGVQGAVPVRG